MKSTKSCKVFPRTVTVTFENPDHVYKRGLPYTGTVPEHPLSPWGSPAPAAPSPAPAHPSPVLPQLQPQSQHPPFPPAQIRLQGADGSGLPQQQVLLSVRNQEKESTQSFLTDSSGRASFQLDASGWSDLVSLKVSAPPLSPPPWGSWSCFLQWAGALELHQPRGLLVDSPPDSHLRLKSAGQLRSRSRAQQVSGPKAPFWQSCPTRPRAGASCTSVTRSGTCPAANPCRSTWIPSSARRL